MTKTTGSLKASPFHEDKLYERLAETYFHQKTRPKSRKKKPKFSFEYLKSVSIAVFSGAAITIAIIAVSLYVHAHYADFVKKQAAVSKTIMLSRGGFVNKNISSPEFRGYAKEMSKFSKDYILLNNPKKYNWAELSLNFKFPLDLSHRKLSFFVKGKIGGEKITLVLRDSANRTARVSDISLASNWRMESISLGALTDTVDLTKITHLRFEYGHIGESAKEIDSPIDVTIYVKDIKISKEA